MYLSLSCLQLGAMTNNGVTNIVKQEFWRTLVCIFLQYITGSGITGHVVCVSLANAKLISFKNVRKTIIIISFKMISPF